MDTRTLRELAASLYEDTPDAVVLYDREGRVLAANMAARQLTGYDDATVLGSSFREHVRRSDIDRLDLALHTAFSGGTDHFDTATRHKDGTIVPLECYVFPAHHDGEIVGAFLQGRDLLALRSAEAGLTLNQEKFRSLFEYHPDGILALKHDGAISRVNVALEAETGFFGEQLVGKRWTELIAPEHARAAEAALAATMRGESMESDSMILDRLGNRIDVQLKLVPLYAGDEISGAYAILKNVAAQRRAERAIETQNEQIRRLYLVAASRSDSLDQQINATLELGLELFGFDQAYVTRFEGKAIRVRSAVGDMTTLGATYPMQVTLSRHVAGDRTLVMIPDIDASEWSNDPARQTLPWRAYVAIQLTVVDRPYGALVFASRAPRADTSDPRVRDLLQLMGLFVAAAIERAEQSERIEQLAFNDPLTGLPNRTLFNERIEHTLVTSRRYARGFAVMYVDIDHFKHINDRFGHAIGDAVLVEVAKRLRETLRESDTIARFGGDEFVVLQPIVDGPSDAADLARKINAALQVPVDIQGVAHEVHASCGIALFPSDATTITALMEAADHALYQAKHEGRNRWRFANADFARQSLAEKRRR